MPSAIELRVGSVDAAARAFALGYDTVCLDVKTTASRLAAATPVAVDRAQSFAAPAGTRRLRLLHRVTVSLDAPRLEIPKAAAQRFDVVAIEPLTDAAFLFACRTADCDVIAVDASRKAPFALPRAAVAAARARGVAFEVSYASAISHPRTLRHLAATAARLDAAAGGARGALAFSSGAAAAWQVRAPADVAAIAAMVGVRHGDAATAAGTAALDRAAARAADRNADDLWVDAAELDAHLAALGERPGPRKRPKRRKAS